MLIIIMILIIVVIIIVIIIIIIKVIIEIIELIMIVIINKTSCLKQIVIDIQYRQLLVKLAGKKYISLYVLYHIYY